MSQSQPAPHILGEELIRATDVSFTAGAKKILEHISLSVHAAEILTLIGPNGAGKTTLAKILLGLQSPTGGSLWKKDGLKTGFVPQRFSHHSYLPLTVRAFMQQARVSRAEIEEALCDVAMLEHEHAQLNDLSGGELQRVLLARATCRKPHLLILDEPVQGMDVGGQAQFYDYLLATRDRIGCGVVMISHDLHMVLASTDRVLCINRHICCSGHPEDVRLHPSFAELFGQRAVDALAPYTHKHDHTHDWQSEAHECHDPHHHHEHDHGGTH